MKKYLFLFVVCAVAVAIALPLFASGKEGKGEMKFAYVCKMLTHPWFIEEENGIKARVAELGLDYVGVDANLDDEACMQAVDNVIGRVPMP